MRSVRREGGTSIAMAVVEWGVDVKVGCISRS